MKYTISFLVMLALCSCGEQRESGHVFEINENDISYNGSVINWNEKADAVEWMNRTGIQKGSVIASGRSGVLPLMFFGMVSDKVTVKWDYYWKCYDCGIIKKVTHEDERCDKCGH